ncbi:MAG TPA: hypothetical protein VGI03_08220 [Verrucomicrobiae bacterium]|jgi:hypothetical protein
MNNQEARLILQAYRCGGQDASDPLFAEALEQARRDPELQKWFAEETALDARIQASLQTALPIPHELKSNLLALRKIIRPAPWWLQPLKLAAAAAVLLLGVATFWLRPQTPAQLASFRETMARYSMQEHGHITFESHDMTKIQQWLQDRGMETNFELPAALHRGPAQGCRVVDWNGRKATMLCFVLDDGEHMDLFVMDRVGLPGLPEGSAPQFAEANGLMTATWVKGDQVYLLTGDNKKLLQKLFQQT